MYNLLENLKMSGSLRTRIHNALANEGIETVSDMRAYLDMHSYIDSSGERQYLAAIYRMPNVGHKGYAALKQLLEEIL